jgi:hypothetical protein
VNIKWLNLVDEHLAKTTYGFIAEREKLLQKLLEIFASLLSRVKASQVILDIM